MKRSTKLVSWTLGIAVAIGVFAVINAGPARAQDQHRGGPQVTVVNEDNDPVPTKIIGTVPVTAVLSNANPIPVSVAGTVNVSGTVNVASGGSEPVRTRGVFVIVAGDMVGTDFAFHVPQGKRFVVENVSTGTKLGNLSYGIGTAEGIADYFVGTSNVEFDQAGNSFSFPIKYFFNQNEDVWIRANRKGGTSGTTFPIEYTIVGYLEPM